MTWLPTQLDIWLALRLAAFLGHHPLFDLSVQSAIRHNVLGGLWFGAALFLCWIQAARKGRRDIELRMLTVFIASALAIALTLVVGAVISCPPPIRYPSLAKLFPDYFDVSPSLSSFPSQSTALYAVVAAGIFSLHKGYGWLLWILVALGVALPRMYVGGHFLSDILAGLLVGLAGYATARQWLEPRWIARIQPFLEGRPRLQTLTDCLVFLWILQVAVEFRDAVWLKRAVGTFLH